MKTLFLFTVPALVLAALPATALASNPDRIEYVLVLDAHGHPRTYFSPGAHLGLRVEVYAPRTQAGKIGATWKVTSGRYDVLHESVTGKFHGPTRGNLFTQTEPLHLSSHAPKGTYRIEVTIAVGHSHLTRSARFWIH